MENFNSGCFTLCERLTAGIVLPVQQLEFLISVQEQRSGCVSTAQKDPFYGTLVIKVCSQG